jgi:hypothetical protein
MHICFRRRNRPFFSRSTSTFALTNLIIFLINFIHFLIINSVNQIQDLGIILAADLSFNAHINKIYGISLRMLGFIKRTCHDFNNLLCLKVLYCSLVRSSLKFDTVLWNPNQLQFINKLEKVQRNFFRFYAYKTMRLNQNMDDIANFAGLKSLRPNG